MNSEGGSETPYNLSKYVSMVLLCRGRAGTEDVQQYHITNDVQNEIRGSRTIIR